MSDKNGTINEMIEFQNKLNKTNSVTDVLESVDEIDKNNNEVLVNVGLTESLYDFYNYLANYNESSLDDMIIDTIDTYLASDKFHNEIINFGKNGHKLNNINGKEFIGMYYINDKYVCKDYINFNIRMFKGKYDKLINLIPDFYKVFTTDNLKYVINIILIICMEDAKKAQWIIKEYNMLSIKSPMAVFCDWDETW